MNGCDKLRGKPTQWSLINGEIAKAAGGGKLQINDTFTCQASRISQNLLRSCSAIAPTLSIPPHDRRKLLLRLICQDLSWVRGSPRARWSPPPPTPTTTIHNCTILLSLPMFISTSLLHCQIHLLFPSADSPWRGI